MAHGARDPRADDRPLSHGRSARGIGLAMAVLGGVAFALLASLLVPWDAVPGGMPAPAEPSSLFSEAEIARAEAYSARARLLGWTSLGLSLVVAGVLGLTPLGSRLLGRLRLPWPVAVVGLVALVLLLARLVQLPVGLAIRDHRLEHGLTRQSLGAWLLDQGLGWGVEVVLTSLALVVLVGCARRWTTWWPAVAGALATVLVVAASYLYPVLVEPVFNDFESMPQGALRTRVLALADEEGVEVEDVLVADASRRTTTLNAYVSGFGDTRRIVVYDTLVDSLPPEQALSVVAHELAHARHHDVLVGTALGAAGAVAGVGLLAVLVGSGGVRRRAGVTGMADPRIVPLVLALAAFGSLASAPVENGVSRAIEARADVDALKATGDPVAFMGMQRRLALRSLADPTPPVWAQWWFGSHPTTLQRVALARTLSNR